MVRLSGADSPATEAPSRPDHTEPSQVFQPRAPTFDSKRPRHTKTASEPLLGLPFDSAARLRRALKTSCRVMRPLIGPHICRRRPSIFGVGPATAHSTDAPPSATLVRCERFTPITCMAGDAREMTSLGISPGPRRPLRVCEASSCHTTSLSTVPPGTVVQFHPGWLHDSRGQ